MPTKFGDAPLSDYQIHRIAENEDGYNYYMYIHSTGQIIIMREKTDQTEYLYKNAGRNKTSAWANRASGTYSYYDELEEQEA